MAEPSRMYKSPLGTWIYSRVIGQTTPHLFTDVLQQELLTPLPQNAKILEIGCGPGWQSIKLLEFRTEVQIVATDYEEKQIERAKSNFNKAKKGEKNEDGGLSFVQADATNLKEFGDNEFDAIFSVGAIKHFSDKKQAVEEFVRVMKKGGKCLIFEFMHFDSSDLEGNKKWMKKTIFEKFPFLLKIVNVMKVNEGVLKLLSSEEEIRGWCSDLEVQSYEFKTFDDNPFYQLTIIK